MNRHQKSKSARPRPLTHAWAAAVPVVALVAAGSWVQARQAEVPMAQPTVVSDASLLNPFDGTRVPLVGGGVVDVEATGDAAARRSVQPVFNPGGPGPAYGRPFRPPFNPVPRSPLVPRDFDNGAIFNF